MTQVWRIPSPPQQPKWRGIVTQKQRLKTPVAVLLVGAVIALATGFGALNRYLEQGTPFHDFGEIEQIEPAALELIAD